MLAAGQIIDVKVQSAAVFGLLCRHDKQDVLVLIPAVSWIASFGSCEQFADPGDELTVKVMRVDTGTGKVAASIREQYPDPWEDGSLRPGTEHQARVVRFVEKADRCNDGPGYLLELMPGAYVMLCDSGSLLEKDQHCLVTVRESDSSKRTVRVGFS